MECINSKLRIDSVQKFLELAEHGVNVAVAVEEYGTGTILGTFTSYESLVSQLSEWSIDELMENRDESEKSEVNLCFCTYEGTEPVFPEYYDGKIHEGNMLQIVPDNHFVSYCRTFIDDLLYCMKQQEINCR